MRRDRTPCDPHSDPRRPHPRRWRPGRRAPKVADVRRRGIRVRRAMSPDRLVPEPGVHRPAAPNDALPQAFRTCAVSGTPCRSMPSLRRHPFAGRSRPAPGRRRRRIRPRWRDRRGIPRDSRRGSARSPSAACAPTGVAPRRTPRSRRIPVGTPRRDLSPIHPPYRWRRGT